MLSFVCDKTLISITITAISKNLFYGLLSHFVNFTVHFIQTSELLIHQHIYHLIIFLLQVVFSCQWVQNSLNSSRVFFNHGKDVTKYKRLRALTSLLCVELNLAWQRSCLLLCLALVFSPNFVCKIRCLNTYILFLFSLHKQRLAIADTCCES